MRLAFLGTQLRPALSIASVLFALTACSPEDPFSGGDGNATEYDPDTGNDDDIELLCIPGDVRCSETDDTVLEVCAGTGMSWEEQSCGTYQTCQECSPNDENCTSDSCLGPCESDVEVPSSAGCEFIANRILHPYEDAVDGLVVGNPNDALEATVSLFRVPEGSYDEILVSTVSIQPKSTDRFDLDAAFLLGDFSLFRTGGNYVLRSDVPVTAYQHSPLESQSNGGNDATMLLPTNVLGTVYVVASYPRLVTEENLDEDPNRPSYFTVIALENETEVQWTPSLTITAGNGLPIEPVEPGQTGVQIMNRFDTMRIAASADLNEFEIDQDVSGTVVESDKPIWVVGASLCSRVPAVPAITGCDPLLEQMIPVNMWGQSYVGARAPIRGEEGTNWRVYAGADDIEVQTDPPQAGFPVVLENRGDFFEFEAGNDVSVVFTGDGPFMPVQYLQGRDKVGVGATLGDPSMAQMIPTEQYLDRYLFVTGGNYLVHYVQVIRPLGGPDVMVDDEVVTGYFTLGDFEVADWEIEAGSHLAESDGDFGIVQVAYRDNQMGEFKGGASYAYPGGMKTEEIYIP